MERTKYYRRRQFALGPEHVDYPGWVSTVISKDLCLTTHPELAVTQVREANRSLTALGYIIDPVAPGNGEEQILSGILQGLETVEDVISGIERLSGRFALIIDCGNESWIFHDAVALRQVQYHRDSMGRMWCASDAHTLSEQCELPFDPEVLDYRDLAAFRSGKSEFWLLNDRTPFRGVFNLLPNHFLDLKTGAAERFWPRKGSIPRLSAAESIEKCSPILVNTIKAASERFDLHMGMSAGIDSRKTLAATKDCRDRITYFSHGTSEGTLDINDVKLPAALLPQLGLEHQAYPLLPMPEDFKALFEENSTWAREAKGKNAYTIFKNAGPEVVVLNSNISEVAQSIYYLPKSKIDGLGLAIINGLNHPFAIAEFQKWLDGAMPACEAAGMDVLALFFLEQRMGRWCTNAFAEYDIAHETFNPYNNRRLHALMLGVSPHLRRDRMWKVPMGQIRHLWPDVLKEPVNPQDRWPAKIQQAIRRFVVHKTISPWLPLYPYLRYLKKKRRFLNAGTTPDGTHE